MPGRVENGVVVTCEIPMPGEQRFHGTVIASVWITDDPEQWVMLLLLDREPPFYRVVNARWSPGMWPGEEWRIVDPNTSVTFENIVPAVEHYVEQGGDY